MRKLTYLLVVISVLTGHAHSPEPLPIGNFALPMAQQPSPLFSFGQNIVDKNDFLGYETPNLIRGKKDKSLFFNQLYFLYGLSDNASIFALINAPVLAKENGLGSSGFGDTIIQGEYAFINKPTETSQTQATIVGSLYLPSGILEASKQGANLPPHLPFTGLGSYSFFLGGTVNHMTSDWYMFTSMGGLITTEHSQTKLGNSLFYQAGLGRNLKHYNDAVLLLLFEFDGFYSKRDKLIGFKDFNSGGNIIYFGPSLYFSTKRLIFQAGAQVPVFQKLNGFQSKNSYYFSISIAWLFNHDAYDR
jgi:hypothetical protein